MNFLYICMHMFTYINTVIFGTVEDEQIFLRNVIEN